MPDARLQSPRRQSWRSILEKDVPAGLINAVVSVPDGLASAALAGVNPVYGLYTSVAAQMGGSLLVSPQLMQTATTSASALAAGQAIAVYPADNCDQTLFLLGSACRWRFSDCCASAGWPASFHIRCGVAVVRSYAGLWDEIRQKLCLWLHG